jgi:hypothetical protein
MKTGTAVWTYDDQLDVGQSSWVGYDVHATDGDIGKIDEMTTETGRGCVVVDTGFWIFGKKRMIPAAAVRSVDHQAGKVNVALTKDQIKNAPDYDRDRMTDRSYDEDHGSYYGTFL